MKEGNSWIEYFQGNIFYCFQASNTYKLLGFNFKFIKRIYFFRGGKYTEDDAKSVLIQILNVVAFCHLQGVVHRDLKPEVTLLLNMDKV